jgi:hypothetical protein
MHDVVVRPSSTISMFSYFNLIKAERWQLTDPENHDDEVRVVRNLYITVSLWVG